jgi:hypothetical protein
MEFNKMIIKNALKKEYLKVKPNNMFDVKMLLSKELPSSAHNAVYNKQTALLFPRYIEFDYLSAYKIYLMEKSILKEGFKKDKPVLLQVSEVTRRGKISIESVGGNHRIQAFKNLVDKGKIPSTKKIPAVIGTFLI